MIEDYWYDVKMYSVTIDTEIINLIFESDLSIFEVERCINEVILKGTEKKVFHIDELDEILQLIY